MKQTIEINGRYFMPHDFEHEIWKSIPEYSNYMVSNFSRIRRIPTVNDKTVIMKPVKMESKTNPIYYEFQLSKDGKQYKVRLDYIYSKVKFRHIVPIQEEESEFVTYRRFSEFINDMY